MIVIIFADLTCWTAYINLDIEKHWSYHCLLQTEMFNFVSKTKYIVVPL